MKLSAPTKAEITVEWWDTRKGQEVYDIVKFTLGLFGCKNIATPDQGWLDYTPTINGKHTGEGELTFTFTHVLGEDATARMVVCDIIRNDVRLKWLDWDCEAVKDWYLAD